MAVTNAPVPVRANINIKVLIDLKLQLRRHTGTLIFAYINLIYLMIYFLCTELENVLVSKNLFNFNNYFFSFGTLTTNKLDDGISVTYFSGFQVPLLELQVISMKVYQ